jgi:hypothetical protein
MSAPVQSAGNATNANTQVAKPATQPSEVMPSPQTMMQAAKLALNEDRAIMLDYYRESCKGTAFLGEDGETKERILVKSKEEFTSLIKKLYKVGEDFIVITENSVYVVGGNIQKRKVNLASLQEAYDNL